MKEKDIKRSSYTCKEYREEMILVALKRRLNDKGLSKEEREKIKRQIDEIERKMGLS